MSDQRYMDQWLKWVAVIGPIISFVMGNCTGAVITYNSMKDQQIRISNLEQWKAVQDAFNEKTVVAIARLKVIVKDLQP